MRGLPAVVLLLLLAACGTPPALERPRAPGASTPPSPPPASANVVRAAPSGAPPPTLPALEADEEEPVEDTPMWGIPRGGAAERVLFRATHWKTDVIRKQCPRAMPDDERVRCLVAFRYEDEVESQALALRLLDETGSLAGLLPEETADDGEGRKVRLLPARPVGPYRAHLQWIIDAFRDYQAFSSGLAVHGPIAFRYRPVDFRFFYSETGGMPSAFATGRNIGYNIYGAVNVSEEIVRDTLFHELFHLNDGWHDNWSARVLDPIYQRIVARCAGNKACLAPYAPTDTTLQGTFYSFVPQGGVREYAAELGLRYYREHRLILQKEPLPVRPFKCGPAENRETWRLLVDEFFAKVDLVPACAKKERTR